MMEGYVSSKRERKSVKGREFEVTTFQGEHCDEYAVKEEKSGECCLYRKGVLELSWREENGHRTGGFTVYEKGKALGKENWLSVLSGEERRYIENNVKELRMIIRRGEENRVVYRGGFDNEESLKREGEGYAYDEESGRVLIHGVWRNDELFQIFQEFEDENEMIEYEVIKGEENVSVLNRRPVYEGGYTYNELSDKYVRHGKGNEINLSSGVAKSECEWSNGELMDRVELFGGWYVKGREEDSLRTGAVETGSADVHNEVEWNSLNRNVFEIVVSSNCCNKKSMKVLDLSELKCLKRIEIGNECFENVNEVKVIGLNNLESVVIGMNSFTKYKNTWIVTSDPNRHFYVKNCPKLKSLKMGRYSFSDYRVCEIGSVDALEVIEMGELNEKSANFDYASLELKSDIIHKE